MADLRLHGVEAIAAAALRQRGRPVPQPLEEASRRAAACWLAAPPLLARIRAACDGPLVLLKGPEVAAHYPRAGLRPFNDLDLLVPDPAAVQAALLAAGFRPAGDPRLYRGIHHLRPLHLEGFPLVVEVHAQPKWPAETPPPSTWELLEAALPAAVPVDGVLALHPAHHAVVLAAHAWAHDPLGRLGQLVDVAVVRASVPAGDAAAVADRWRVGRIWSGTASVVDAVFLDGKPPWPLRTWARHLREVRDRTVLETHAMRWLHPLVAEPPGRGLRSSLRALHLDLRPAGGEGTTQKARRGVTALRNAFARRSEHDAELERRSLHPPHPILGRRE